MSDGSLKSNFVDKPKAEATRKDGVVGVPAGVLLEDPPVAASTDPADASISAQQREQRSRTAEELELRRRIVRERYPFVDPYIDEPQARKCCAIGTGGVLGLFQTELLAEEQIPGHRYGSSGLQPIDSVGQTYTARGGFVDLGHVRDLADMTRYLATHALLALVADPALRPGEHAVTLTGEGGRRTVVFKPAAASAQLAGLLGARAAYDLAIWHEVVTWFINQRYSSFSPEDNFSNLLGCLVGAQAFALQSPYDRNVDGILMGFLKQLAIQPLSVTEKANRVIGGVWYDNTIDLTGPLIAGGEGYLLRRHLVPVPTVTPWLVTDLDRRRIYRSDREASVTEHVLDFYLGSPPPTPYPLEVPMAAEGRTLADLYDVEIAVNLDQVPLRVLPKGPSVRSADLPAVVAALRREVLVRYPDGDQPIGPD